MGRSRSATLVIMYLLYKTLVDNRHHGIEIDAETMVKYVQTRRSVVDPNKGFMKQIKDFEVLVKNGEMQKRITEHKAKVFDSNGDYLGQDCQDDKPEYPEESKEFIDQQIRNLL